MYCLKCSLAIEMVSEHFWEKTSIHRWSHRNGHITFLDKAEWYVQNRIDWNSGRQVTARIYLNSEGGQQVTFHSALRIEITNIVLKASTDPASLICLGRLFHKNKARDQMCAFPCFSVLWLTPAAEGMLVQGCSGFETRWPTCVPPQVDCIKDKLLGIKVSDWVNSQRHGTVDLFKKVCLLHFF